MQRITAQRIAMPTKKPKHPRVSEPGKTTKPQEKHPAEKHPAKASATGRSKPAVPLSGGVRKPSHLGGLGRGLDSLIGRAQTVAPAVPDATPLPQPEAAAAAGTAEAAMGAQSPAAGRSVLEVETGRVHNSPWQPRRVFDDEALQELADSIRVHGIIQPLVCRLRPDGDYELIGGERRLRAASLLGLEKVPVIVMETADHQAAELALVENLQREDLNVIEEAEGYKALSDQFKLSQTEIAERVGKARATVTNTLRLLELPDEVKSMLGAGLLSTGHAKVLLSLDGDAARMELARQCLNEGLTVRALERRVQRRDEESHKQPPQPDLTPEYLRTLLEKLHEKFATSVRLTPSCTYANGRHGRGRIEIDFADNDGLGRLLELFGIDVNAW